MYEKNNNNVCFQVQSFFEQQYKAIYNCVIVLEHTKYIQLTTHREYVSLNISLTISFFEHLIYFSQTFFKEKSICFMIKAKDLTSVWRIFSSLPFWSICFICLNSQGFPRHVIHFHHPAANIKYQIAPTPQKRALMYYYYSHSVVLLI